MELVSIPITEFYQHSLSAAKSRGFLWVITLLARDADVNGLYLNLKKSWLSLNSITGDLFLFVFAGKENTSQQECCESSVTDADVGYFHEYNDYVQFINPNMHMLDKYIKYKFNNLQSKLYNLEKSQTSEVNALRDYLAINERDIPCLIFTSLHSTNYDSKHVKIVPIAGNDIYMYFKHLFNDIDPLLKQYKSTASRIDELSERKKELEIDVAKPLLDLEGKILALKNELILYSKNDITDDKGRSLLYCINNLSYGKFDKPLRSTLNKYIDLVKKYEKETGNRFDDAFIKDKIQRITNEKAQAKIDLSKVVDEQNELVNLCTKLISRIDSIIGGSKMNENINNDNKVFVSVNGGTAQINTAFDNAKIDVIQYSNSDNMSELIDKIRQLLPTAVSAEDVENVTTTLNVIECETSEKKPRKNYLKLAINSLKAIKGTAEFSAAVAELIQFISLML